jgi:hypothetical protein
VILFIETAQKPTIKNNSVAFRQYNTLIDYTKLQMQTLCKKFNMTINIRLVNRLDDITPVIELSESDELIFILSLHESFAHTLQIENYCHISLFAPGSLGCNSLYFIQIKNAVPVHHIIDPYFHLSDNLYYASYSPLSSLQFEHLYGENKNIAIIIELGLSQISKEALDRYLKQLKVQLKLLPKNSCITILLLGNDNIEALDIIKKSVVSINQLVFAHKIKAGPKVLRILNKQDFVFSINSSFGLDTINMGIPCFFIGMEVDHFAAMHNCSSISKQTIVFKSDLAPQCVAQKTHFNCNKHIHDKSLPELIEISLLPSCKTDIAKSCYSNFEPVITLSELQHFKSVSDRMRNKASSFKRKAMKLYLNPRAFFADAKISILLRNK